MSLRALALDWSLDGPCRCRNTDRRPRGSKPFAKLATAARADLGMAMVAAWLSSAGNAVYGHYLGLLGPAALHDQREAAVIMSAAGLPAFAVPAVARLPAPRRIVPAQVRSEGARA